MSRILKKPHQFQEEQFRQQLTELFKLGWKKRAAAKIAPFLLKVMLAKTPTAAAYLDQPKITGHGRPSPTEVLSKDKTAAGDSPPYRIKEHRGHSRYLRDSVLPALRQELEGNLTEGFKQELAAALLKGALALQLQNPGKVIHKPPIEIRQDAHAPKESESVVKEKPIQRKKVSGLQRKPHL